MYNPQVVNDWGLRQATASGVFNAFLSAYGTVGMLVILW